MKKIVILFWSGILLILLPITANALDLMAAYRLAADNDPIFKEAVANYLEEQEATAQSRSALLPQINLNANLSREKITHSRLTGSLTTHSFQAIISQELFNLSSLSRLVQAHASVKAATYQLAAAHQELILRLAGAYFNMLLAQDLLQYTGLERDAIRKQVHSVKERMDAGHATITALDQT